MGSRNKRPRLCGSTRSTRAGVRGYGGPTRRRPDEIGKKFEWLPHTVRGAIAGALKKKLGLDVQSEKVEGRGRVYRIAA
jgi:hypothetical protein